MGIAKLTRRTKRSATGAATTPAESGNGGNGGIFDTITSGITSATEVEKRKQSLVGLNTIKQSIVNSLGRGALESSLASLSSKGIDVSESGTSSSIAALTKGLSEDLGIRKLEVEQREKAAASKKAKPGRNQTLLTNSPSQGLLG